MSRHCVLLREAPAPRRVKPTAAGPPIGMGRRYPRRTPPPGRNYTNWSNPVFAIGIDHTAQVSARIQHAVRKRQETTGTIRINRTREGAAPLTSGTALLPRSTIGISAGQSYRTSSPVTARPISIRWISDVPSKIVKIVDYGAVSAGQRSVDPLVSARIQHGPSEGNDGLRPARILCRS